MKKSNNNTWKRIAAGALSLALVAGALPANVGGLLTGGKGIDAHAADPNNIPTAVTPNDAGIIQHNGTTYTAVPAEGYHFDHWNITGYFYPENNPLISTENPYTFSSNNYNYYTITAVFAEDPVITDISTANITATASTYNGSALTPTIKLGDTTLTNGTDYTYEVYDTATPSDTDEPIGNPINAGTYYVKVTGIGAYTGTKIVEWNVSQATLEQLTAPELTYNGSPQALIAEPQNIPAGVQFKVTTPSDYEEEIMQLWNLQEAAINDEPDGAAQAAIGCYAEAIRQFRDGNQAGLDQQINNTIYNAASVNVSETDTEDYLIYIKNNLKDKTAAQLKEQIIAIAQSRANAWSETVPTGTDAGSYTVWYKGNENFTDDSVKFISATINKATLDFGNLAAGGALVHGEPSQLTYNGEEQTVKLYYRNGNTYVPLTAGTDYELNPEYPDGSYFDGCPVYSAATDVSNDYEVVINPKGNYKLSESNELGFLVASWSIAKADLAAGTDYTAPTGSDDLKYKAADIPLLEDGNTGSVAVDSNTSEPVGTMQYAATRYRAVSANELRISSIDDVAAGDIYKPTYERGIYFPVGYKVQVGSNTYTHMIDSNGVNFYLSSSWNKCFFSGTNEPVDYNALRIKEIDKENKIIKAEFVDYNTAFNELVNNLEWSEDVPKATDLGNWYVWYKVEGDANHNSTKPAYVTSKIDYNKSTLTLADSLGKFKVTEVANGTETEVTADNDVYTLTATKTYKIYTKNTVSTDEKSKYRLTEAYHDKENDDDVFEYEYTLKLAVDPAFEAYNLSHLSNWTGKVNSTDPTKLYIADGEVTPNTGKLAATLKANSTYYYGDVIDASSVEIDEAYKDLIKVKNVYFSDSTGAAVDINNAKYGTYTLRAEIVVDNNANGAFDDKDVDLSYTVYKNVEYKARPMNKNDYFLLLGDKEYKLEIPEDSQTVTVPNTYWWNTTTGEISLTKPEEEDTSSGGEPVEGEPEQDQESNWVEQTLYTYDQQDHIPEIVVRNGGNNEIVLTEGTIDDTDKDYSNSRKNVDGEYEAGKYKDAGSHYYQLIANRNSTKYELETFVNIQWTIAKADISGYISVAPKNNVDTDEVKGNDAIVYDGADLDGTDYIVSTNEAYTNLDEKSPVKALVDEYLDQLKATPATDTTEAVPAKTVVAAEAANAGEYPKSESPYPKENTFLVTPKEENDKNTYLFQYLIKSDNTHAAADDIIIMPKVNDNDESVEFKVYDSSEGYAVIYVYSDGKIGYSNPYMSDSQETSGPTFVDAPFPNTTEYGWYIEQTGTRVLNQGTDNQKTVNVYTISAKKYPTGDLKNAGEHTAKVTVTNSNFKDITQDIKTTIAKRSVTLTPDANQKITYRDTEMPDLTYSIEEAKADGLTGVVAADKAKFQKTIGEGNDAVTKNAGAIYVDALAQAEANAQAVAFKYAKTGEGNDVATDYTTALLNNAGSYTYAAFDFDNYVVVFPDDDDAPTFTVDPLDISNIKDLNIVLNGKTNDWTQDDNSGYYTYDGTTKAVSVKKVSKSGNGESVSAEFSSHDLVREHEGQDYSATKDDVTVYCKNKSDSSGNLILLNNENDIRLEVSDSMIIESVELQIDNNGTYTINGNEYTTDNNKLTIPGSAISDNRITCSNAQVDRIKVNCTTGDEYVLEADTDYTVGGMTKSATVGEKTVQVKGKGNYTGVAKATWKMKPVEDVEGLVTFKINDDATPIGLPQDVQYYDWHYTGEPISCGAEFIDPDSNYAQDAEVTVKYTHLNNITEEYEEVDEAVHQGKYKVNVKVECDGYSPVEFNYDINISPKEIKLENTPFTINYGEDYSDHTDELIALFVKNGLLQSDADLIKQMLEDGTLIWYYDGEWLYPTWSEDVLEAAAEEAVKEGKKPENWTVIESMIHKLYGDAVYQVANAHDNDIILVNPIIKPKSIKSDDVTVEFTNGNTVVLDENGFVEESSIIVKDTGILNDDGEPTVLLAGTDYELNIESTATEGEYIVEIVGKGNYRAIRKVTFTAITAAQAATKFDIEFVETYVSNNKNRIKFNASAAVKDGYTVKETGVIYFNAATGTPEAELTMDNVDGTNIKKARNLADSYTVGLLDNGNGVYARFYTIVNDGTNDYVVYATDEAVVYNYAELSASLS